MTCLVIWIPLLYGYHVIGFASKLFMIKKAFAWSDICFESNLIQEQFFKMWLRSKSPRGVIPLLYLTTIPLRRIYHSLQTRLFLSRNISRMRHI